MNKRKYGPSLYYASDKNVFDALNQHKVDSKTIVDLFERRNIVVSKKTPRENLAAYFARQIHDYQDHKDIAARLGIAPRRERITSMEVNGNVDKDHLTSAIDQLKEELEKSGEVVHVTRDGSKVSVMLQYSTIDYKVNEFAQRQERDGTIELIKTKDGFTVRNTHNEYVDSVTELLISKLEKESNTKLEKVTISLFDVPSARLRSKFFHKLAFTLPGYQQSDVTAVYVYKAKPETITSDDEDDEDAGAGEGETHVERVHLRGQGVTRSEILNELLDEDNYYITKIAWEAREIAGSGHDYDIEASFTNPKECTGFSYILNGVYPYEDGKLSSRRRPPLKHEIDEISLVVENRARELMTQLRVDFKIASEGSEDAD